MQTDPNPSEVGAAFRAAMVDAARARGGAGAQFIADGHTNLWLDIAYDAFAALRPAPVAVDAGTVETCAKAVARALRAYVADQPEDAQMLPAIQFIFNRDDLIGQAVAQALSTDRVNETGGSERAVDG